MQLGVAEAEALATQLALLVDGSIAQDLVRDDPSMARAAKEAATVLLKNAGVEVGETPPREKAPAFDGSLEPSIVIPATQRPYAVAIY